MAAFRLSDAREQAERQQLRNVIRKLRHRIPRHLSNEQAPFKHKYFQALTAR
jgi:hypothetical protein